MRQLREAIRRANEGLIDADLGGGVIKQRIARPNEGRSGGYRSIILFRKGERAIFAYGFAKNEKSNIEPNLLMGFRKVAHDLLTKDEAALELMVTSGGLRRLEE